MRTLCLYLPRLATTLALRQRPMAEGLPVALLSGTGADALVAAVSTEAASAGILPGMPAGTARLRCPSAAFLPDNPATCLDEIERLAVIIATYATPLVVVGGRDHLFVGMDGLESRFADETTAANRLATRLRAWAGTDVRAGVGSTRAIAHRAARCAHRYPLSDDEPADAMEAPIPPLQLAKQFLSASTDLARPVPPAELAPALLAFARRTDIVLAGRSCRRVELRTVTGSREVVVRVAPIQPVHTAREALDLVVPRLSSAGVADVRSITLVLGGLGPDVRVRPLAPGMVTGRRQAPDGVARRRPRQLLLRAAS